jgi:uncharacterized protein (TIGR04222 family)
MSPFDLRGPEFLVFYAAYIALLFAGVKVAWSIATAKADLKLPSHPYEIAFLRSGAAEAARVAFLNLLRSRVVFKPDDTHYFADKYGARKLTEPLEKSVVRHFASYATLDQAKLTALAEEAAPHYKQRLAALGLWAGRRHNAARLLTMFALLAALWIVAGMKISIAEARGHSNVGFLIALASAATFGALIWMMPESRTRAGVKAMATLRALNKDADRASDYIFYAAIFGSATVALAGNPFYREAAAGGGDASVGGSGCGSGGGDGGGGGCGGCGGGGGGD